MNANTKFILHEYDYRNLVGDTAYGWAHGEEPISLSAIEEDMISWFDYWYRGYTIEDPSQAEDIRLRAGESNPLVIDAAAESMWDRVDPANYRLATIHDLAEDILAMAEEPNNE